MKGWICDSSPEVCGIVLVQFILVMLPGTPLTSGLFCLSISKSRWGLWAYLNTSCVMASVLCNFTA